MHSLKISTYTHALIFAFSVLFCQVAWSTESGVKTESNLVHGKAAYLSGKYDEAANYLLPIANQGNAESQYYVGLIYSTDGWPKRNVKLAMSYLLSAADQHYKPAMGQIGRMYESGTGAEKNLLVATDWLRKSRDQAVSNDIKLISVVGNDKQPSWSKEIEKFKVRANAGDVEAQYRLASIYDAGVLEAADVYEAYRWYKIAANNGHQYSMFMTGYFLCRGLIGEVDYQKANGWFDKSGRSTLCH